jgi:hypothetical protein
VALIEWPEGEEAPTKYWFSTLSADLVGERRYPGIDTLPSVAFALPVERLALAELLEQDHGQLGPAKPRGVTWNGAGGCVIVSQSRHENFLRTG